MTNKCELKKKLSCLYQKYKRNGYISWDEFRLDQNKHKEKVIMLKNSDFIYGTIRLRVPCGVILKENIVFNPDNGDGSNDQFDQNKSLRKEDYQTKAYRIGFFAAITLEADNIIIDMNGKNIRQSARHHIFQRIHAHIELGDQPFIPKEGPLDFGDTIDAPTNVHIFNGSFGLSSHHNIHGNNTSNVLIENITFENFEVASIAINGTKNVFLCDLNVKGNFKEVPIVGIFSNAVILQRIVEMLLPKVQNQQALNDLTTKYNRLTDAINHVVEGVLENGVIDDEKYPDTKMFKNEHRMVDGNSYGILINRKGMAVLGLQDKYELDKFSHNIYLENVNIDNIHGVVKETVGLSNPNEVVGSGYSSGFVQNGPVGEVFQITESFDIKANDNVFSYDSTYKGNVMSDMHLALVRWSNEVFPDADPALVEYYNQGRLGTLNIDPSLVPLAYPGTSAPQKTMRFIGNGDSMFHTQKGIFGLRIDGVDGLKLKNVNVCNIKNYGEAGSELPGPYVGGTDGGHPDQGSMIGYTGADTYGIATSSVLKKSLNLVKVTGVYSKYGSSYGIMCQHDNDTSEMNKVYVKLVNTEAPIYKSLPNKLPQAVNLVTDNGICITKAKSH